MARLFSDRQRKTLYVMSGGYCSQCGAPLHKGWHADHIQPHSKGGDTELVNGQALCPVCNLKKGASMYRPTCWPAAITLRNWQQQAFMVYNQLDRQNFMAVATPGAGKTILALRIAHSLLLEGTVERVVIVCPTSHLCEQWAEKAALVYIHLDPTWENGHGAEANDYHGVCVTYHQVASQPDISAINCRRKPTLVILDEPHHMGESLSWGNACREAFQGAKQRFLITGTPFRSDNNPIPFVEYNADGLCRADFTYSYGEALRDKVCRPVLFPSYEGEFEWFSRGEVVKAQFADQLDKIRKSERLRAALSVSGEYLLELLAEADYQLTEIRRSGHPDAAGLVIARDQFHAKKIAELLEDLAEEPVSIAISEDPDASKTIKWFNKKGNRRRWIVAVKMISEGVDIPRLRVGVYATNVLTELFFRQAVGRFVRMIDGLEEQTAYLYIPADEALMAHAQKIKEERQHQLQELLDSIEREAQTRESGPVSSDFRVGKASDAEHIGDVFDGEFYRADELVWAERIRKHVGDFLPNAMIAQCLRVYDELRALENTPAVAPAAPIGDRPRHDVKTELRRTIKRMVAEYHQRSGTDYADIHAMLARQTGSKQAEATVEQLERRITILRGLLGL